MISSLLVYMLAYTTNDHPTYDYSYENIGILKGDTPIHVASMFGENTRIVELLIKYGANLSDTTYAYDSNVLLLSSNYEKALLFIKNLSKEDINKPDKFGETPLMSYIRDGNVDIVKLLLKNGADPNYINDKYEAGSFSPLELAIIKQQEEMVETLLLHGANVNAKHP